MSNVDPPVEVVVDQQLCAGHGRCIVSAPDVFGYDDVTNLASVLPEAVLSESRDVVHEAARGCPEAAIIVNG